MQKKMPDYIQKVIKDLHSESEEIKKMKLESDLIAATTLS